MKDDTVHTAWQFAATGERFELLAGTEKLKELREAIRGIPSGNGDFALGPEKGSPQRSAWDEMCLWIWWMPKRASGRITSP